MSDTIKVRVTAHLPERLAERVQIASAERGQTLSMWIQRAVEAALHEQEATPAAARGGR